MLRAVGRDGFKLTLLTLIESFTCSLSRSAQGKDQPQFTPLPLSCPTLGHAQGEPQDPPRQTAGEQDPEGPKTSDVICTQTKVKQGNQNAKLLVPWGISLPASGELTQGADTGISSCFPFPLCFTDTPGKFSGSWTHCTSHLSPSPCKAKQFL